MVKWTEHISRCRLDFQMRRLIHSLTGKRHLLAYDCYIFLRQLFRGPAATAPSKPLFYSGSGAGSSRYSITPNCLHSDNSSQ